MDHTRQQTGEVTAEQLKSYEKGVSLHNCLSEVAGNRINESAFKSKSLRWTGA